MFEKINAFECKLTEKITEQLRRQSTHLTKFEDDLAAAYAKDLKKAQEELRRKDDDFKKMRRRSTKDDAEIVNDELYIELAALRDKLSAQTSHYLQF